jgi:hypothetical protein
MKGRFNITRNSSKIAAECSEPTSSTEIAVFSAPISSKKYRNSSRQMSTLENFGGAIICLHASQFVQVDTTWAPHLVQGGVVVEDHPFASDYRGWGFRSRGAIIMVGERGALRRASMFCFMILLVSPTCPTKRHATPGTPNWHSRDAVKLTSTSLLKEFSRRNLLNPNILTRKMRNASCQ